MKKQLILAAFALSVLASSAFAQATISASRFNVTTGRSDFAPTAWCVRGTMTAASNTIAITATTTPASMTGVFITSVVGYTSATTGVIVPVTSTVVSGLNNVVINAPSTNVVDVCGGIQY
jgi:hypothetical protein